MKAEKKPYILTSNCWIKIGIFVLIYNYTMIFAQYLNNPFLPGAIIAIYMAFIIIGGHLLGKVPGLLVGLIATFTAGLFKMIMGFPDFAFEFVSIIPHGIMGYIAGTLGNQKNALLSSLAIVVGHALNVFAYSIVGLVAVEDVFYILFHIGLIAEIMLEISIIVLGINLTEKYLYNDMRVDHLILKETTYLRFLQRFRNVLNLRIINSLKIALLVAAFIFITNTVYSRDWLSDGSRFYLILYLLPILFAGLWFGYNGALTTSVAASIFLFQRVLSTSLRFEILILEEVSFYVIFFNIAAIIIGDLKKEWVKSLSKIEDLKYQEEQFQYMLSHFLDNSVQKALASLELFREKYKKHKNFDESLYGKAIDSMLFCSDISRRVNKVYRLLDSDKPSKWTLHHIRKTIQRVIDKFQEKETGFAFIIKNKDNLDFNILADDDLSRIFKELFSFIVSIEEGGKILIDGEKSPYYRIVKIRSNISQKIPEKILARATGKITKDWIYHGYYLRIAYATILVQKYDGTLTIGEPKENQIQFLLTFPI